MIYLFDTNVVSEAMKPDPHPQVAAWLDACPRSAMHTTAITVNEILYGVRCLPEGQRRAALEQATRTIFADIFAGRVLPFDRASADLTASIRVACRKAGRPVSSTEDVMIAGIAQIHGATIVTRDQNFDAYGVAWVDPWQGS